MTGHIGELWQKYCIEENFIGIGSTRKVYRHKDYAIKVHLHPIGYKQSLMENEIFQFMKTQGLASLFAETFYADPSVAVQKYYEPLPFINLQSFEIDRDRYKASIQAGYEKALRILDAEFDSFDLKDSSNYGFNEEKQLVFIDYGMTRTLYEDEWVPLAECGVLPQIYFERCISCGIEKELRMYGEDDEDKRCLQCGKE
ncbi:protein kinase [Bacillus infantis]|uniref:Protein kinase n=1 Tax=Bacillus infantis TaxID=324767 RepID=A0A5D4RQR2_9BACI|nr:protein kinase [Bacillus infantis]TYS52054.1 protein kinase [Bacillus infantis]